MVHPPPWPERPVGTRNFDEFWLVPHLPPQPFPDDGYDYGADRARFGPPGTHWIFSFENLVNRETEPGVSQGTKLAIERILKKLAVKLPPAGSTGWATPYPLAPPAVPVESELLMPMDWIRTQVVGQIGNDEEVVHVLNWRHSTIENAPIDAQTVKVVATAVRNGFTQFVSDIGFALPPQLHYTEVRGSAIHQAGPAVKPEWPLPTQVVPFAPTVVGVAQGQPLPYEVALCLSLNTNWRGTSRFRGRVYLGPLAQTLMANDGQFGDAVQGIGQGFGTRVLDSVEQSTDYELHVISQKFNTSAKITGVRVGRTPDSQRRRRRDRPELYTQAWGSPVGAL